MSAHVSHSQMTQWLRCGKSYELNRIKQAPRVPAVWLASGVALHEVIDQINRDSVTGEQTDIKAMWDRVYGEITERIEEETGVPREHWKRAGRVSKDKPNKEDSLWWGIEGYKQLVAYKRWLSESGNRVYTDGDAIYSEYETTAQFGDVTVKGFLDAVMVDPNGEPFVMDAKSGTRVPTNQMQLGLYAAALKLNGGPTVTRGAFMMTRNGELTDFFDLTKYTPEYFTPLFSGLRAGLDAGIFLPNPGDACWTCDVKDACFTAGGIDSWKFDTLNPNYVAPGDLTVSSA